jgi:DNA-binding LacI/PurR family transcriptional regulator
LASVKGQVAKSNRRATIVDVARDAGVSAATVSNAINNVRYVNAETRARIDEAAARLGYTPNIHARRMRSAGVDTIGLFSSMPFAVSGRTSRLGFLMEIAASAAVSALERGYSLLLVPPLQSVAPRLEELSIDAALVLEPLAEDFYVERLSKRGIPLVTIGNVPNGPENIASVDLRSTATAEILLAHLRETSVRIALITGTPRRNSYVETERAYLADAAAHRMEPVLLRVDETGGEEAARDATLQLLHEHPETDAILALVDTFASGALRALADSDIAVPGRIRVATRYDGYRARESQPALTAIDLHLEEVSHIAIELLLEQLGGASGARTARAPMPTLIRRRSTALEG